MEEINRPQSLKEIAAERIREAIVEGRLKMGDSLSENFLAQNLTSTNSLSFFSLIRMHQKNTTYPFSFS